MTRRCASGCKKRRRRGLGGMEEAVEITLMEHARTKKTKGVVGVVGEMGETVEVETVEVETVEGAISIDSVFNYNLSVLGFVDFCLIKFLYFAP